MRVSTPQQKAYLHKSFYSEGQGRMEEKKFPLAELKDAASCVKKLLDDADKKTGAFSENAISFTAGETVILKKLFDEIKEVAGSAAAIHLEIQAMFDKAD